MTSVPLTPAAMPSRFTPRPALALVTLALVASLAPHAARGQTVAERAGEALSPAASPDVRDLPLVELPASAAANGTLAIFLTGDGGWASLDRGISRELAAHGIGVVGFNSRAYLSNGKSPDRAALDVARVARAYMARWHGTRLVLVGYSRGADMLPFVVTRLPAELRARTAVVAMLGLATSSNFHFHLLDMVRDTRRADDLPTAPELARMRPALPDGARLLCVYGEDEKDSGCRGAAPAAGITAVARAGGHHFDGDDRAIGDLILAEMPGGVAGVPGAR